MQPPWRTIAIIGGGFSGTVLAANLLRRAPLRATRVVLIERGALMGCGVAYGPSNSEYLLNTPAGRMSAASAAPEQLVEFARRRLPEVHGDAYLSRALYGEYLREFLDTAQRDAPPELKLERLRGEVTAIRALPGTASWLLHIGEQRLCADQVVLACGDPPPADRHYAAEVAAHPAYMCDPHAPGALDARDDRVLVIGTGLTMVDLAVAAAARNPGVHVIALSRHGLLPEPQLQVAPPAAAPLDLQALLQLRSTLALVAGVRALARRVQAHGGDWREVIVRLRPHVPALWHKLEDAERQRFLRHVRTFWDVHRHRMPPALAARVATLRGQGQLQVRAGRIERLCPDGDRIRVRWRPRGQRETRDFDVARVVDCSGADRRLEHTRDPLWRQLLDSGLATPDAAGLGLLTAAHGALIGRDGGAAAQLYYLGPMLRADHWEATAVAELAVRAESLAAWLARPDPLRLPMARSAASAIGSTADRSLQAAPG